MILPDTWKGSVRSVVAFISWTANLSWDTVSGVP